MEVAFLGLGLIGGSIARALRAAAPDVRLSAWTPGGAGPAAAQAAGVVDRAAASPLDAISGAELVVLAGPPLAVLEAVEELGRPGSGLRGALRPDATVTDVASTKAAVCAAAERAGLPFVGGHPMAGRETSGWAAGEATLFRDRPWVIVPTGRARERDTERVTWLAARCGATPVPMMAADHDAAVAAVSHLPLVVAAALVEAVAGRAGELRPDWPAAAALAASGWRDMTRLARGDARMAAGILATNAGPIAARLAAVRDVLDEWLALLAAGEPPDATALERRFAAAAAAAGVRPDPPAQPGNRPPRARGGA